MSTLRGVRKWILLTIISTAFLEVVFYYVGRKLRASVEAATH
jgi:hypothetical protein